MTIYTYDAAPHFAGLDYAYGRFTSVDPLGKSANAKNPGSWNRYTYTLGDPINRSDPRGTCSSFNGGFIDDSGLEYEEDSGDGGTFLFYGPCDSAPASPTGGLEVFANDLGNCTDAASCMAFAQGTGDNNNSASTTSSPPCETTILNAVNAQFGTNLDASNVLPSTSFNPQQGGQVNPNIGSGSATGLTASQFNAIQPGRYAPPSIIGVLTGAGASLHIPDGPSGLDPTALPFSNSNIGGVLSVTFTAHIDSAWASNPIWALAHYILDVLGASTRAPCP